MPTGYTAGVGNGSVKDFSEFAMQCARAFDALILMRDEPNDAPIPEEFEPHDYREKSIASAKVRLAELSAMSEQEVREAAEAAYGKAKEEWWKRKREKAETRARYEAMLAEVRAWTPPTPEHHGLKEFMEKQLTESIEFDCGGSWNPKPIYVPHDEWLNAEIAAASNRLARATEEHRKEVERARGRTAWVRALRESLNATVESAH